MFIVRWLLSHPIIFVWVLAAVALLMGYSMDKGADSASGNSDHVATVESSAGGVEHVATAEQDAAMAEQAATTEQRALEEPVVPVEPVAPTMELVAPVEPTAPAEPAPVAAMVAPTESAAVTEAPVYKSDDEKRVAEASTEEILSVGFFDKLFGKSDSDVSATEVTATSEPEMTAEEVAASVTAESSDAATSNAVTATAATQQVQTQQQSAAKVELLRSARDAFWANDYNASINYYQQLIMEQPDVIDHKGELANVYWTQGSPEKAAELYADIAMPLVDLGKIDQVKQMNDFIGQFLPERAREIAAKLHP